MYLLKQNTNLNTIPFIQADNIEEKNAKIEYAYGEAMCPQVMPGDVLKLKPIKNKGFILWGETYKIVTNGAFGTSSILRSIHPCEDDDSIYVLRAANEAYRGDVLIKKEDIVELYLLTGLLRSNHM